MADHQQAARLALKGKRVLVIEDEYYIADDAQRILTAVGATVVGPVATLSKAHEAIADGQFDCVLLDLNLQGESAVRIADRLVADGRAVALATGYGSDSIPRRLEHLPRLEKPFEPERLIDLLEQAGCACSAD